MEDFSLIYTILKIVIVIPISHSIQEKAKRGKRKKLLFLKKRTDG